MAATITKCRFIRVPDDCADLPMDKALEEAHFRQEVWDSYYNDAIKAGFNPADACTYANTESGYQPRDRF